MQRWGGAGRDGAEPTRVNHALHLLQAIHLQVLHGGPATHGVGEPHGYVAKQQQALLLSRDTGQVPPRYGVGWQAHARLGPRSIGSPHRKRWRTEFRARMMAMRAVAARPFSGANLANKDSTLSWSEAFTT